MTKQKQIFRVGILLLTLCMVSTVMVSGTFAKYTSEYSGQDTALIARWEVHAATVAMTFEDFNNAGFDIDTVQFMYPNGDVAELRLFDHAYNTHINQKDGEKFIIAPGTSGVFTLGIVLNSDVDADVKVEVSPLEDNPVVTVEGTDYELPILYSADRGSTWVPLEELAEAVAQGMIDNDSGFSKDASAVPGKTDVFRISATSHPGDNVSAIQEVYWKWPYAVDVSANAIDTLFGQQSASEDEKLSYGIRIKLTVTQAAPEIQTPDEP